jgi:chromosome segregation ATPase
MKDKVKQLQGMLDKLQAKKQSIEVEKALLQKEQSDTEAKLKELGVTKETLEATITHLEARVEKALGSVQIPKELLQ